MKRFLSRTLGPVMVLAILAMQAPSQAAATRTADGLTQATAAGSCWEIKLNNPSATDGVYWLVTPKLQAPQQFYCDQTSNGGGWVLVGRGRQGWKNNYDGLGTPAQVRDTPTGTAAFAPAQLPAKTIDGLLNGTNVSSLTDGIRLRRAGDRTGSSWQEVRFKMANRDRWAWTFGAQHTVGAYTFSGVGGNANGSGGQTVSFGTDQLSHRVNTQALEAQGFLWGFSYGTTSNSQLNGTNDPSSYIWSATNNTSAGRPFTQMFIRPQVKRGDMFTTAVPDSGTAKQEQRALPDSNATKTVWGVNGLADGIDSELHTEVQGFAQVGTTMFVGGNFKYVQQDAIGTNQVAQSDLAGFDVNTGEFIPSFNPVFDGQVKAVEALPDGRLAVGGEFTTVNGVSQPGLAFLDATTGALSGTQVHVERRNGAGAPFVRGLDAFNGYLYVAGAFTHLVSSTTTASDWNGGRVNLSTGKPDTSWNPLINGTSVGVNASPQNDRVYFAGYFTGAQNVEAEKVTAFKPTAGAALAMPGWQPYFSTSNTAAQWQLDVQEVGNRFYYGGSQHLLAGYDRTTLQRKSGTLTLSGGDIQTITANSDTVFAGCHCGDYAYQDAYTYPTPTGFTEGDSINTFGAWDAATGVFEQDWNPIVKGRKGYGAWAMDFDSKGNLWVGGDYATSIRSGYVNQWSGGFMRYAPRDATAPTSPSNLTSTSIDPNTFKLSWTGSTDNASGALTYEVIEGNRVIATTTSTSATVSRLSGTQRYFVRAVDVAGNRSASTSALSVSGTDSTPAPPAAPNVTGSSASPTTVHLSWPNQADATGGFIVKRNGTQVGSTLPAGSTSYDDTGLTQGTAYTYTVSAVDTLGQQTSSAPVSVTTVAQTTYVGSDTSWRWRFAATAPDSGWFGTSYDDSSWATGSNAFGFGSTIVTTDISVGAPSPRPLSAQFRTTFNVPDVSVVGSNIKLTFVADDGVVLYLNGLEVTRQNLPAGTLTSSTYATAAPRSTTSNANPVTVTISKSSLVNGTNVLAAESHVNFRTTPDLLFKATLTATQ
jgi:hypothetical protein